MSACPNIIFIIPSNFLICYTIENITEKYENLKKGVTSVMGGRILDYDAKDILNEGKLEGKLKAYISLVKDGILSISQASKHLGMEDAEFKKYL